MVLLNLATPIRLTEIANRLGRVAASPQPADRRHAGIVPAPNEPVAHQLQQLPLAHHRVRQVQPGEFNLLRMVDVRVSR